MDWNSSKEIQNVLGYTLSREALHLLDKVLHGKPSRDSFLYHCEYIKPTNWERVLKIEIPYNGMTVKHVLVCDAVGAWATDMDVHRFASMIANYTPMGSETPTVSLTESYTSEKEKTVYPAPLMVRQALYGLLEDLPMSVCFMGDGKFASMSCEQGILTVYIDGEESSVNLLKDSESSFDLAKLGPIAQRLVPTRYKAQKSPEVVLVNMDTPDLSRYIECKELSVVIGQYQGDSVILGNGKILFSSPIERQLHNNVDTTGVGLEDAINMYSALREDKDFAKGITEMLHALNVQEQALSWLNDKIEEKSTQGITMQYVKPKNQTDFKFGRMQLATNQLAPKLFHYVAGSKTWYGVAIQKLAEDANCKDALLEALRKECEEEGIDTHDTVLGALSDLCPHRANKYGNRGRTVFDYIASYIVNAELGSTVSDYLDANRPEIKYTAKDIPFTHKLDMYADSMNQSYTLCIENIAQELHIDNELLNRVRIMAGGMGVSQWGGISDTMDRLIKEYSRKGLPGDRITMVETILDADTLDKINNYLNNFFDNRY